MQTILERAWEWIVKWDFYAIFYSIVAAVLVAVAIRGRDFLQRRIDQIRALRARFKYRKRLRADCEHLIVPGRRGGFKRSSVFVDLDIAPSEMSRSTHGGVISLRASYVLVGGPGAGKSTLVKKLVADRLEDDSKPLPVMLRLKHYVGYSQLEDAIAHELKESGFPQPEEATEKLLRSPQFLCVLDGLDEVKPEYRKDVCREINRFYSQYFTSIRQLVVTCRKEAFRDSPLDVPSVLEVRPLSDDQIKAFSRTWPPGYPQGKSPASFWRDLSSSTRVLELARSPLLLVGGLMQYTESDRGIPEERFQYLQRVAHWLLAEWPLAQGHPPDVLRSLYDRLLPKLAFQLHKQQLVDIADKGACELIEGLLPKFGFPNWSATDVLESIRTKTGILVRDDKNNLVFAQLGLQEYFASVEIVDQIRAEDLASLKPVLWWREPLLLAVAQQRDPESFLERLFVIDPLLAAAAVAECPTPSLGRQKQAWAACLRGLDRSDESVAGAMVSLLRKVSGNLEGSVIRDLEARLAGLGRRSRIVGQVLATAGTKSATSMLAQHPEVWEECLKGATHLSESFDALLMEWIESGSDEQSAKASEIVAGRARAGAIDHLLALLPRLPEKKSDALATFILQQLALREAEGSGEEDNTIGIRISSQSARYVRDSEYFLRGLSRVALDRAKRGHGLRLGNLGYWPGLAGVAVAISRNKKGTLSEGAVSKTLHRALAAANGRRFVHSCAAASLLIFFSVEREGFRWGIPIAAFWAVYAVSAREHGEPWSSSWEANGRHGARSLADTVLLVAATVLGTRAYFDLSRRSDLAISGVLLLLGALVDEEKESPEVLAERRWVATRIVERKRRFFELLLLDSQQSEYLTQARLRAGFIVLCVLLTHALGARGIVELQVMEMALSVLGACLFGLGFYFSFAWDLALLRVREAAKSSRKSFQSFIRFESR